MGVTEGGYRKSHVGKSDPSDKTIYIFVPSYQQANVTLCSLNSTVNKINLKWITIHDFPDEYTLIRNELNTKFLLAKTQRRTTSIAFGTRQSSCVTARGVPPAPPDFVPPDFVSLFCVAIFVSPFFVSPFFVSPFSPPKKKNFFKPKKISFFQKKKKNNNNFFFKKKKKKKFF